jgi:hypothetical protein
MLTSVRTSRKFGGTAMQWAHRFLTSDRVTVVTVSILVAMLLLFGYFAMAFKYLD